MPRAVVASVLAAFLLIASVAAATPAGSPPGSFLVSGGPAYATVDFSYAKDGLRGFTIETQAGWRLRAEAVLELSEAVGFQCGVGLARDLFAVHEEGDFPAPDGSGTNFEKRVTRFDMLHIEVPLKVALTITPPGAGADGLWQDGLCFTLGPLLSYNLFGEGAYAEPGRAGMPPMRNHVAFEFGGTVFMKGPGGRTFLFTVDYAVDLSDRFGPEARMIYDNQGPYDTWDNLKLRRLGVSAGMRF